MCRAGFCAVMGGPSPGAWERKDIHVGAWGLTSERAYFLAASCSWVFSQPGPPLWPGKSLVTCTHSLYHKVSLWSLKEALTVSWGWCRPVLEVGPTSLGTPLGVIL